MQLVSAEEILAFLPNERNTPDTLQNLDGCERLAQAQAENYAGISFASFTPESVPGDIKTALIKWSLAEFIANRTNTNYAENDGDYADRASRHRKEARELLDKYRPPVGL